MRAMVQWGPSHQAGARPRRGGGWKLPVWMLIGLAVLGFTNGALRHQSPVRIAFGIGWIVVLSLVGLPAGLRARLTRPLGTGVRWVAWRRPGRSRSDAPIDPLSEVRQNGLAQGGGVYLGQAENGVVRHARAERAVLLLGPPRSGKTSGMIIPAILAHTGPVVSTSTKPDVTRATRLIRALGGRVWMFDPTGSDFPSQLELRWSPVTSSRSWGGPC